MKDKDFELNPWAEERRLAELNDRRWLETLRISQDPFDKVTLRMVTRGIYFKEVTK